MRVGTGQGVSLSVEQAGDLLRALRTEFDQAASAMLDTLRPPTGRIARPNPGTWMKEEDAMRRSTPRPTTCRCQSGRACLARLVAPPLRRAHPPPHGTVPVVEVPLRLAVLVPPPCAAAGAGPRRGRGEPHALVPPWPVQLPRR